jgi:ribonuclease HII
MSRSLSLFDLMPPQAAAPRGQSESPAPAAEALEGIGVDEAGRGCLAGPVVAAAVLFPPDLDFPAVLPGLGDSKKLGEKARDPLAPAIRRLALAYGIGLAWQEEIDRLNILHATFRAMARAVLALAASLENSRDAGFSLPRLLIDGNKIIPASHWDACAKGADPAAAVWETWLPEPLPTLSSRVFPLPPQEAVVHGDAIVPAISAASILAKTTRDALMTRLDDLCPGYGLAGHKGYGTAEHLALLAEKGPCPLHRRSFKHVRPETTTVPQGMLPGLLP